MPKSKSQQALDIAKRSSGRKGYDDGGGIKGPYGQYTQAQRDALAAMIYGETSAGVGPTGKMQNQTAGLPEAKVAINRSIATGKPLEQILAQPKQFQGYNPGSQRAIANPEGLKAIGDKTAAKEAINKANQILNGNAEHIVGPGTPFHDATGFNTYNEGRNVRDYGAIKGSQSSYGGPHNTYRDKTYDNKLQQARSAAQAATVTPSATDVATPNNMATTPQGTLLSVPEVSGQLPAGQAIQGSNVDPAKPHFPGGEGGGGTDDSGIPHIFPGVNISPAQVYASQIALKPLGDTTGYMDTTKQINTSSSKTTGAGTGTGTGTGAGTGTTGTNIDGTSTANIGTASGATGTTGTTNIVSTDGTAGASNTTGVTGTTGTAGASSAAGASGAATQTARGPVADVSLQNRVEDPTSTTWLNQQSAAGDTSGAANQNQLQYIQNTTPSSSGTKGQTSQIPSDYTVDTQSNKDLPNVSGDTSGQAAASNATEVEIVNQMPGSSNSGQLGFGPVAADTDTTVKNDTGAPALVITRGDLPQATDILGFGGNITAVDPRALELGAGATATKEDLTSGVTGEGKGFTQGTVGPESEGLLGRGDVAGFIDTSKAQDPTAGQDAGQTTQPTETFDPNANITQQQDTTSFDTSGIDAAAAQAAQNALTQQAFDNANIGVSNGLDNNAGVTWTADPSSFLNTGVDTTNSGFGYTDTSNFVGDNSFDNVIPFVNTVDYTDNSTSNSTTSGGGEIQSADIVVATGGRIEPHMDKAMKLARRAGKKDGGSIKDYPLKPNSNDRKHAGYSKDGGKMQWMSPDHFLDKSEKMDMDKEDKKSIKRFKKKIKAGKQLNPLALYPSGGQDGRHRATAAKKLGIKQVPVITWPRQERASGGTVVDRALMLTSKKAASRRGRPD